MIRKIIQIDQSKCNGCGACAKTCHEGAIEMVQGKAMLTRDDYCDGFGDCLPNCPTGAITFTEREAAAYNEKAVQQHKMQKMMGFIHNASSGHQCPGSMATSRRPNTTQQQDESPTPFTTGIPQSRLQQWPVQIKLLPTQASFYENAHLLIAADCTAYAYENFHGRFIKNHITLVGCPKLDDIDYSEKLTKIIATNNIKSVTLVRMDVPCCGGLEKATKKALQSSGKFLPWHVVVIGRDGTILEE